jgi:hypothetical protein
LHQPKLSTCAQVPTPREVCSRLNIWNRAHLATYYKLVDGMRPYTLNPDADYGRIEVFHRAAAPWDLEAPQLGLRFKENDLQAW